jgi:capsular polysaccharide transport system ATP-binding protein
MVSHAVGTIKTFCTRGGVLIDGKMLMFPDIDQAIDVYSRLNR